MTAVYIIGAVILLLALLLMTRGGAEAEYSENGFSLTARFGLIRVRLIPLGRNLKKRKPRKKREKKREKKAPPEGKQPAKGGTLERLKLYLPGLLDFLNGFRKRLRVDELTVWFMSAGDDAAKTAITYGRASAAMGVIASALENSLDVRKRDLRAFVSFEETKPRVYLKAAASVRAGQVLYLGIRLGLYLLKHRPPKPADTKGKEDKNG